MTEKALELILIRIHHAYKPCSQGRAEIFPFSRELQQNLTLIASLASKAAAMEHQASGAAWSFSLLLVGGTSAAAEVGLLRSFSAIFGLPSARQRLATLQASSLGITSHSPSLAIIKHSSSGVISKITISGADITTGFRLLLANGKLQMEQELVPQKLVDLLRQTNTWRAFIAVKNSGPPDERSENQPFVREKLRSVPLTFWSIESGTVRPPRLSTARESPQLATRSRPPPTTATTAVEPTISDSIPERSHRQSGSPTRPHAHAERAS
ncbi:hypothetical protein M5K25_021898 [Dendrobium thyrsiflorum]|uniref:Uncharacterized protein n=1 Tax=Dendrobium thyrsiflorum TaxID=117978 RepID=A0ABD0U596_DENTH